MGFAIYGINRWTARLNHAAVILAATATGVFVLVAHAMDAFPNHLAAPMPQWSFGLAAAPLGYAVGRCLLIPSRDAQRMSLWVIALVTLTACIILNSTGFSSLAIPYGLAMGLVCTAYAWPVRSDAFVASVAPLTFGIYLIHPLISFGLKHVIVADQHYAAFIALTTCISGLVTLGLTKTPLRRFV